MAGFLGKTPGAWTTVESADQCKLMNGHCDLWKTPPWESRGCSQILFFVRFIPLSAFSKLLPGQRCFAALSSEWLNNSGESDFSCTSLGLCLWSNTTQGLDTLKTPLRIWLEDGEKWLWQKQSVNDGPPVQSKALNVRCEKILTVKAGNKTAFKESRSRF